MPDQVQLRGGTAADNDGFTGVNREVTVDTTNKTLRVHDGVAAGGHPLIQGTASSAADADTIAKRDAWGRLQVADPQDAQDVTSKSYVDTTVADSLLSATSDEVATAESTGSNSHTDLATVGPSVTVTIPASGEALILLSASISNSTASNGGSMSVEGAGITPQTHLGLTLYSTIAGDAVDAPSTQHFTGLTTGEQTFTAKYRRRSGGTATFSNRRLTVIPLP